MLREVAHDSVHAVMIPLAAWLYKERAILQEVLEHKLERRHPMINVLTLLQDLSMATTLIPKIQAAIPQIQKTVADVQQAVKDGKDPAALTNDLNNVLTDLTTDINALASLFPTPLAPAK